jgi:hypothetical protein
LRADGIEALATMNHDAAQRRSIADARALIEGDAVAPGAAPALARALVAATPRADDTEKLLTRLLMIAPEVGIYYRDARAEIVSRRSA